MTAVDALIVGALFYFPWLQTEVEPSNMRAFCRKFLEELPPVNYNTFVYILSFLREVVAEESYNRTSPSLLAAVCVANMTYSAAPPVTAASTTAAADGGGGGDFSLVVLSKDERARRAAKQGYLQAVITCLLSTTSSL